MNFTEKVEFMNNHPLRMCEGCKHRPLQFCAYPCSVCKVTIEKPSNFTSISQEETKEAKK
jgi:hypothetical protein